MQHTKNLQEPRNNIFSDYDLSLSIQSSSVCLYPPPSNLSLVLIIWISAVASEARSCSIPLLPQPMLPFTLHKQILLPSGLWAGT